MRESNEYASDWNWLEPNYQFAHKQGVPATVDFYFPKIEPIRRAFAAIGEDESFERFIQSEIGMPMVEKGEDLQSTKGGRVRRIPSARLAVGYSRNPEAWERHLRRPFITRTSSVDLVGVRSSIEFFGKLFGSDDEPLTDEVKSEIASHINQRYGRVAFTDMQDAGLTSMEFGRGVRLGDYTWLSDFNYGQSLLAERKKYSGIMDNSGASWFEWSTLNEQWHARIKEVSAVAREGISPQFVKRVLAHGVRDPRLISEVYHDRISMDFVTAIAA